MWYTVIKDHKLKADVMHSRDDRKEMAQNPLIQSYICWLCDKGVPMWPVLSVMCRSVLANGLRIAMNVELVSRPDTTMYSLSHCFVRSLSIRSFVLSSHPCSLPAKA